MPGLAQVPLQRKHAFKITGLKEWREARLAKRGHMDVAFFPNSGGDFCNPCTRFVFEFAQCEEHVASKQNLFLCISKGKECRWPVIPSHLMGTVFPYLPTSAFSICLIIFESLSPPATALTGRGPPLRLLKNQHLLIPGESGSPLQEG